IFVQIHIPQNLLVLFSPPTDGPTWAWGLGWANRMPFLLSKGLSVVALDKMGCVGIDTTEDVKFYPWKRAADDIATFASQLGLSRSILGGHDFGGVVVHRTWTSIWHPDLFAAFYMLNAPSAAPTASSKFQQAILYIAATRDFTLLPPLPEDMETDYDSLSRCELMAGIGRGGGSLPPRGWLASSVLGSESLNLTAGFGLGAL
ncbi:epoxide hydrolase, partial [Colletotrichum orchidophilum]